MKNESQKNDEELDEKSKNAQTISNLEKNIAEAEKVISSNDTRCNSLEKKAEEKKKLGDEEGANQLLLKRQQYIDQIKELEELIGNFKKQIMMIKETQRMKEAIDDKKVLNEFLKSDGMSVDDDKNEVDEDKGIDEELAELEELSKQEELEKKK